MGLKHQQNPDRTLPCPGFYTTPVPREKPIHLSAQIKLDIHIIFHIIGVMQISHNAIETGSDNLTGVILAGGQSQRMGRDKARLDLDGTSLFTRARQALEGAVA